MYFLLPIVLWLLCFAIDKGSSIPFARRGGGGTTVEAPAPPPPAPSPLETSQQAIQAQIEATPQILATQQEFGPQFTQLQLDQLREFGPQFAQEALALSGEFGPELAQQTREQQAILDPSRIAGSEAITSFLEQGPEALTAEEERQFTQDVRSAQSVRGLAESGFGAQDEFSKLTSLRQNLKNRFLNVALSASGRLPATGQATVGPSPQSFGPAPLVQNVSPGTFFGGQAAQNQFTSSIFGTQANIFGTQQGAATAARGQNLALIGSGFGAVGTALGCWIAKEIFGSWEHPKTHRARNYINNIAPEWFREFYLKHGEKIAEFISNKPILKLLLKPLFEVFALTGGQTWQVS